MILSPGTVPRRSNSFQAAGVRRKKKKGGKDSQVREGGGGSQLKKNKEGPEVRTALPED